MTMSTENILTNYEMNARWGIHTVKATLQFEDYTGHMYVLVDGNCKGRDILTTVDFWEEMQVYENNCQFTGDIENDLYSVTLSNPDGKKRTLTGSGKEMNELLVAVEIVGFRRKEW